ncbi:MAG TPA: ABC transporter permease [Woeseiaceae bacterium]
MSSLATIVAKDIRLLLRDRPALIFILVAPIIVICVAGFSLASLYGTTPAGGTAYVLPIVDEDGGELARRIEQQLVDGAAEGTSVRVQLLRSRAEAERLVHDKRAGSALVIPEGTRAALAAGKPARLLLYTDPVKYLERLNVHLRVLEAMDALAAEQQARAVEELNAQRRRLRAQLDELATSAARLRTQIESAEREAQELREQTTRAVNAEATRLQQAVTTQIDAELNGLETRVNRAIAARVDALREPAAAWLDSLQQTRRDFDAWFAELQRRAGRRAEDIPPPPVFPKPPPELLEALDESPPPVELPERFEIHFEPSLAGLPPIPSPEPIELMLPDVALPAPATPAAMPAIEEISAGGGPVTMNTFDQNVPGFSVTFLLLGMLFGVSLGLLDERDWGTLDRVRALPVPAGNILIGKLVSRFAVGVVQMILLFAVGYALFGISLGPQPWALFLPIAGIAFAGTAFGLIVAVLARSRDAVLPLGSIAIVTMAAIGGCWWPIDLEPQWMQRVALAFPTSWTMEAFNDLMIRRRGPEAALVPTAVLLAFGALYLAIGLVLFRRWIARPA